MKKIYKQISGALLMLTLILNITACSPESFTSPNEAGGIGLRRLYPHRRESGNQLCDFLFSGTKGSNADMDY